MRSDARTPWGGRVCQWQTARRGRSPLANSLVWSLARQTVGQGPASSALPSQGHVPGVCQHVPCGGNSGGVFFVLLQVPASPNCHECITEQPIKPVFLYCSRCCIRYARDEL